MRHRQGFELRSLPAGEPEKRSSHVERAREAAAYWDSLTLGQAIWALCRR